MTTEYLKIYFACNRDCGCSSGSVKNVYVHTKTAMIVHTVPTVQLQVIQARRVLSDLLNNCHKGKVEKQKQSVKLW